jgi:hypothetical protein
MTFLQRLGFIGFLSFYIPHANDVLRFDSLGNISMEYKG